MTFKQKIVFIISLAFFQIFYLLSNYTGQYLNSFFLLTCLTAAILCYNLYQLLMQLFTSEKVETELNLLKKQQLLNSEHLLLMNQQEATSLKAQKQFSENLHPYCEDNLILAILESKRLFAQHLGIHTDYKIFLPEKSNIQSSDLCSVLFNILDNAIEACRSSESSEPYLSLSLTTSKGFISILVKNSKNPQTVFDHTTTKKDSFNHGLGLSIIEDICHKYDGSWQWHDYGNTFESVILLRY